ncbi:MAG: hypothetical protein J0I93_13140 [Legionella sp.]|nr:hypothetical protein [Legionella sp.]
MKKLVNLFNNVGLNSFYESIRTSNQSNNINAIDYWNERYYLNSQYLDIKFISEFSYSTEACLWELTLCDYLRRSPGIELLEYKAFGKKNKSKPDFCFLFQNKKYYLEATVVNPGEYSELNIKLEDLLGSSCRIPREEFKEKICAALNSKVQRYKTGYRDIFDEDDGFIIAISSSPIGMHINPNDPLIEASCLYGFSERQYYPDTDKVIINEELSISKKKNGNRIDTDYFATEKYDFISGVLVSRELSIFYPKFENLKNIISELEDESVYYHNPKAKNPLPRQALSIKYEFESRDEVEKALVR